MVILMPISNRFHMIHNKRGFQFKNPLCREFQLTNPLEIAILALEKKYDE